ncbi:MAG: asparagine synthase B [Bacteriovoracaceae bacterium]|nr:asparagine synthase B [Bacteriovoracaceae bacterium]
MCGLFGSVGNALKIPQFKEVFNHLVHRGPDDTEFVQPNGEATLAFHRLAIMDPTHAGDQPFKDVERAVWLICNGEVYNYQELYNQYKETYAFKSHSDCEPILPLYRQYGIEEAAKRLDAEFALVIWDGEKNKMFAARDPIGIRPLFYGYSLDDGKIMFASEVKVLSPLCKKVEAFPPGHYYDGDGNFKSYRQISEVKKFVTDSQEKVLTEIRDRLIEGVRKRLVADVPVGYLLSGGLDSSLVCGIAAHVLKKPLVTFSVGLNKNPIDLPYAKKVADFIHSTHHEVYFTEEETLANVRDVIWHLETWDITTIRASIGMYLVCKYIHEKTKIKVVLTGEVSDEIFGYKYTDFAPNGAEFQKESVKRIDELYLYDVLRADRCISAHSLEARVPFADLDFVSYCMSIPPVMKMNTTGMGKYILRKAFEGMNILPDEILWREKAAFSDAVGHSMVDTLKAYAEQKYSDADMAKAKTRFPHGTPFTKESLWYREIFEEFYPGRAELIKDFWMPNKSWEGCNVSDPSARVLSNYGKSGV